MKPEIRKYTPDHAKGKPGLCLVEVQGDWDRVYAGASYAFLKQMLPYRHHRRMDVDLRTLVSAYLEGDDVKPLRRDPSSAH